MEFKSQILFKCPKKKKKNYLKLFWKLFSLRDYCYKALIKLINLCGFNRYISENQDLAPVFWHKNFAKN